MAIRLRVASTRVLEVRAMQPMLLPIDASDQLVNAYTRLDRQAQKDLDSFGLPAT
jgi:hypothetical protein